jgi:hypothetical protein
MAAVKLSKAEKVLINGTTDDLWMFASKHSAGADWRGTFDEIVASFADYLPKGYLQLDERPHASTVVVRSPHGVATVPLEKNPPFGLDVAAATAAVLAPDFEAHAFNHSVSSDTHAYLVRPKLWWDGFRAAHPRSFARVFAKPRELPNRFTLEKARVDPRTKPSPLAKRVERVAILGRRSAFSNVAFADGRHIVIGRPSGSTIIDLSSWPPRMKVAPSKWSSADRASDGRWFVVANGPRVGWCDAAGRPLEAKDVSKIDPDPLSLNVTLLDDEPILWDALGGVGPFFAENGVFAPAKIDTRASMASPPSATGNASSCGAPTVTSGSERRGRERSASRATNGGSQESSIRSSSSRTARLASITRRATTSTSRSVGRRRGPSRSPSTRTTSPLAPTA